MCCSRIAQVLNAYVCLRDCSALPSQLEASCNCRQVHTGASARCDVTCASMLLPFTAHYLPFLAFIKSA